MPDLRPVHYHEIKETLPPKRREVLISLCVGPATAKELAQRMGWDKCSVRPRLTELKKQGLAETTGLRRDSEHEFRVVPEGQMEFL